MFSKFYFSDPNPLSAGSSGLERANLMILSKHTTDKGRFFKMQQVVASKNDSVVKTSGKRVWKINCYLRDERSDLGLEKIKFPEITLVYFIQAYLTFKIGENISYSDYFTIAQIIAAAKVSSDICNCKPRSRLR